MNLYADDSRFFFNKSYMFMSNIHKYIYAVFICSIVYYVVNKNLRLYQELVKLTLSIIIKLEVRNRLARPGQG